MKIVNLIPNECGEAYGYWCTWGLQNYLAATGSQSNAFGFTGHSLIADMLSEENIRKYVLDNDFLKEVRGDLFLVYDVGWDVPQGTAFDENKWLLGSQEVAVGKFPSCSGNPVERLRKLDEITRRAGWRGAGLWIPAHAYEEGKDGVYLSQEEQIEFFRQRLRWSAMAGIKYWKVDYGVHCGDRAFRKMLTELGREEAPDLLIEHARNGGPLNDVYCPWDTPNVKNSGLFKRWNDGRVMEEYIETAKISVVFRTYDVSYTLATATTLGRVSGLLEAFSGTGLKTIVNCENEPVIGAVLGFAIGIMSSVFQNNILPQKNKQRDNTCSLNQFVRALRWQRLAPAWGVGIGNSAIDGLYLMDSWDFRKGSDWIDYLGEGEVGQLAPSRIARDLELPFVYAKEEQTPFVICSRHPNGAVSIATLPRVSVSKGRYYPRAGIEIELCSDTRVIGIFGRYESIELKFPNSLGKAIKVFAQDLACDEARDITNRVAIKEKELGIPGELLEEICGTSEDIEDMPGIVLEIRQDIWEE